MFILEELQWRGLLQDQTPGVEELLKSGKVSFYVGFDPTSDSLHIGNLVPVMLMTHLQRAGHKPIALVGGATGRIGDPSGKTQERQLLDEATIDANVEALKEQLMRFINFDDSDTGAEMVNNYDWFKDFSFLGFIREVGKHLTVNYMMAKDSVKNRLEQGMSFTEFSYQLIQGYDFLHLARTKQCKLQVGGSDQWGNITTGTELIRRIDQGDAEAFTAPLLKKADGTKFGKSEGGNVWLSAEKTSPYKFYQYWLNQSDEDAERIIKVFSLQAVDELKESIAAHKEAPHERNLQRMLAEEMTGRIHGKEALDKAIEASQILFGKSTRESLAKLSEQEFLDVFEGVPRAELSKSLLTAGVGIIALLGEHTQFLASNGEARRALKQNAISLNKEKVGENYELGTADLVANRYLLLQKGKKNYFLVEVVD